MTRQHQCVAHRLVVAFGRPANEIDQRLRTAGVDLPAGKGLVTVTLEGGMSLRLNVYRCVSNPSPLGSNCALIADPGAAPSATRSCSARTISSVRLLSPAMYNMVSQGAFGPVVPVCIAVIPFKRKAPI